MNLGEFKTIIKTKVPQIKDTGITDDELTVIINRGCNEANLIARVFKGYTDFNIVADQQIYSISSIATTYLGMDKKALWIKDANDKLTYIFPKTEEWLNKKIQFWRDADSTTMPQYYVPDGDNLIIYPACNENRTNGGRLYHIKKAIDMSNDDNYPFSNTTTEMTALIPLDKAIISYCRWQIAPVLNKDTMEDQTEKLFYRDCNMASKQIKRRPDLGNDSDYVLHYEA